MNSKCRLKIMLVILTFLFSYSNIKAEEEIGSQHSVGLGFLYDYEYSEPYFMHLRSGKSATDDKYANIGFLYNYKNAFIKNGYLTELELDSSAQYLTQTYWSIAPSTMKNIDVEIYNLRALYGLQLSEKLMLKSGLGYRYLYHTWTCSGCYDREQDYTYIPLIAELKTSKAILKIEYNEIIDGNHTAYVYNRNLGYTRDLSFKNDDGYMWKFALETTTNGFTIEPYYEFMSVGISDTDSAKAGTTNWEPANITNEIGIRIKKEFNSKRSTISNYKKFISNDDYYFGMQAMLSEVESGFYSPTGSAKIDEEDTGFSIVSGMKIIDGLKGLPIKLDFEVAFNQFGDSKISANNGDSITTDGRYWKGTYAAGTVITNWADNNDVVIESYSTSIGIKPSFEIINNLHLNANIGLHRWDQSEVDHYPTKNYQTSNYKGNDIYYGFGIGYLNKGFTAEIEYLEYDMYYDANTLNVALKYNF